MKNRSPHIVDSIRLSLQEKFSYEALKSILDSSQFDSAQYLCIKNMIEEFVLGMFESFSQKVKLNKGTELELNELKRMLNYKDLRSVMNWCGKNDVFVISQGNSQFVNKHEFTLAFYKPFISRLKTIHKNWKDVFMNYLNGNLTKLLPEAESQNVPVARYKPKTAVEKSFLNKMKEL